MKRETETHVLMIDDDENDAMLVRHMLAKMQGSACKFRWASSYDQGLKALGELDWDLCLVDYQLGARTGVEVVTESRSRGVETPFLMLTGAGNREVDLQAMRAGARGYLEKSRLCPTDLERAIRYAIGCRPDVIPPSSSLRFVSAEVTEWLKRAFAAKTPFVGIALMLDREAVLRNHLSTRHVDRMAEDIEKQVRGHTSLGEEVFRIGQGNLLVLSTSQNARDARQFLTHLLAEPLALSGDDRTKTVSLPAVVRRSIFSSDGYMGPGPMAADVEAFFACSLPIPVPSFRNI